MSTLMKFRLRSLFVGVGLAMLVAAEPAQAQTVTYNPNNAITLPLFMDTRSNPSSLPGSGWYTMAVIQNTSASTANVRVTATSSQGVRSGGVATFTIDARGSKVVRPDNPAGIADTVGIPGLSPAGNFEGSLLIESDESIVVVGELSNIPVGAMGTAGGTAKGFYDGIFVNSPSGTLAFPMMKSGFNGKSTVIYVTNTSAISGDATVTLKTNDGMTYTAPVVLAPGEFKVVKGSDFKSGNETWTKTCTGSANALPGAACFGAATLESNTANVRFAAVAVQRSVAETSPSPSVHVASFQRANATEPVSCPVFRNAYQTTARSGISVMNAGSSSVDITLKLINTATQTPYTQTFPGIPSGRSVVASYLAGTIGGFPDGAIGAATITSTLAGTSTANYDIVAAVSESGVGTTESSYQCSSRIGPMIAPFVKFNYSDANHPAPTTSEVRIQNTGPTTATVVVDYFCRNASGSRSQAYTVQKSIAAGSSTEINSASFITATLPDGIPTGSLCYAVVGGGSQLVGTVIERSSSAAPADDAAYEFQQLRPDTKQMNPCPSGLCSSGVCCSGA